jgi:hypothetical protein
MRSSHLRAIALAVTGLAAPSAAPAQAPASSAPPAVVPDRRATLVERVLAVVDERPLLLTDVRTLAAVRGLDPAVALEAAIDERLMYAEASRLAQADVSAEEETRALAGVLDARPELRAAVSEPDLRRLLRRQATILRYVEFRFRPQVRVEDGAVRAAWEAEEAGRPAGAALEDAQEAIRERLERQALDERVEAWVKELRARAEVRYVEPPLASP